MSRDIGKARTLIRVRVACFFGVPGSGWGVYRRWVVSSVVVRDLVAGTRTGATSGNGVAPD